jgi:hypothetical protein
MEQITLSGEDWAVDEACIVHGTKKQFFISVKKSVVDKLKLGERDIIKIYAKKVGHEEKEKREIKNNLTQPEHETVAV